MNKECLPDDGQWTSAAGIVFSFIINPLGRRPQLGGLAQLARAPALQAGGQRFESVILHLSPFAATVSRPAGTEIFDMLTHKTVSKDL